MCLVLKCIHFLGDWGSPQKLFKRQPERPFKTCFEIGREGWHLKNEFGYPNSVLAKGDWAVQSPKVLSVGF